MLKRVADLHNRLFHPRGLWWFLTGLMVILALTALTKFSGHERLGSEFEIVAVLALSAVRIYRASTVSRRGT
jgi:hypothetical protein